MGILVRKLRVNGYRSLNDFEICFDEVNVLFGKNNSGKSNIISALELAFSYNTIDDTDLNIFSEADSVIIDVQIKPTDETFGNWYLVFGSDISFDKSKEEFFAFRSKYIYDEDLHRFKVEKLVLSDWDTQMEGDSFNRKIFENIVKYKFETNRDIITDLGKKTSTIGSITSKLKLSEKTTEFISDKLESINVRIKKEFPVYEKLQENVQRILPNHGIEVTPTTREAQELYKGSNIYLEKDKGKLPISNFGSGTRNWAVFSALKTALNEQSTEGTHNILLIEEPEAHMHPNGQKSIFDDIVETDGQKFISTHSTYILQSTDFDNLIYVSNNGKNTSAIRLQELQLDREARDKINRFILKTKGDLFFSDYLVLFEGETEELALPLFYSKYFESQPFESGLNFASVDGTNYEPFIRVCDALGIKWFILSDSEAAAKEKIVGTINRVYNPNKKGEDKWDFFKINNDFDRIIFHKDDFDFEKSLIDNEKSLNVVYGVLNKFSEDGQYIENFKIINQGQKANKKRKYKDNLKDYKNDKGNYNAVLDILYLLKASSKCLEIYEALIELEHSYWPKGFIELFEEIGKELSVD